MADREGEHDGVTRLQKQEEGSQDAEGRLQQQQESSGEGEVSGGELRRHEDHEDQEDLSVSEGDTSKRLSRSRCVKQDVDLRERAD